MRKRKTWRQGKFEIDARYPAIGKPCVTVTHLPTGYSATCSRFHLVLKNVDMAIREIQNVLYGEGRNE